MPIAAARRLFENHGPGKGLQLVEDIPHPEGRLKSGEINADKPGARSTSLAPADTA